MAFEDAGMPSPKQAIGGQSLGCTPACLPQTPLSSQQRATMMLMVCSLSATWLRMLSKGGSQALLHQAFNPGGPSVCSLHLLWRARRASSKTSAEQQGGMGQAPAGCSDDEPPGRAASAASPQPGRQGGASAHLPPHPRRAPQVTAASPPKATGHHDNGAAGLSAHLSAVPTLRASALGAPLLPLLKSSAWILLPRSLRKAPRMSPSPFAATVAKDIALWQLHSQFHRWRSFCSIAPGE